MARRLKTLGLALVAVMALSAVVASASQASNFTAESYPVTLTGEQSGTHEFTAGAATIKCTSAVFDGTAAVTGPTTETSVTPTYSGCSTTILGSTLPVTVTHNGCTYKFHTQATGLNGTVDVVCPAGKTIEVHIYASAAAHEKNESLCTLTIGSQSGLTGVSYVNMAGSPKDVTVNVSKVPVAFTRDGSALCGNSGTASYTGNTTVTAKNSGGTAVGIDVG